jgi:hypothetical protein
MSGFHFSLLNGMFSTSQMISKEIIRGLNLHTKCPILSIDVLKDLRTIQFLCVNARICGMLVSSRLDNVLGMDEK